MLIFLCINKPRESDIILQDKLNYLEMMQVDVVSRETIKPSSPTPAHKKDFKLSLIDQLLPSTYVTFFSYYSVSQTKNCKNLDKVLKESLSEALTIYYPFSGRLNEGLSTVDCNDNGVLFITTCVDCELFDLLASPRPKIESFDQLSPDQSDKPSLVVFQLNKFTCGGIAISFCFYHLLIDAITMSTFLKCWSEIASKVKSTNDYNILPAASMFPHGSGELSDSLFSVTNSLLREGRGTMRRFVFQDSALSKIKETAKSERVPNPSRVEALTGFIWKNMMEASKVVWGYKQPSILCSPVDLRRRMQSRITSSMLPVGNIVWKAVAHYSSTTSTENNDVVVEKDLVWLIRQSYNKIKDDFIPKLLYNRAYDTIRESLDGFKETISDRNLNPYKSSSWNKIGLTDIDFGWGKPIWVSFVGGDNLHYKNFFYLIDDGVNNIEAWITLDQREMDVLETNPEFLACALPNPGIFVRC